MFRKYAKDYFLPHSRILEIGPDSFPSTYQSIIADSSIVWDTLDLYKNTQLTYSIASEYTFPIADNTYDIILSGQVIEHVRKTWVWMQEVARVCKTGGIVITVNPVSWPYHEAPIDCWRIFPEGMRTLYEEAGLKVLLSTWESLETTRYQRSIPGRSAECQSKLLQIAYQILGRFGFPVECAYDTITIGQK